MMSDLASLWEKIPEPIPLAAGILFLLAGWLLYWVSLNTAGAVLGGGLGLLAAEALAGWLVPEPPWDIVLPAAGLVVGGIIGMGLARFLHRTAFFLAGMVLGSAGWFMGAGALRDAGAVEWIQNDAVFALGVPVAGVLAGLLFVLLDKYIFAAASAVLGSVLTMIGLGWPWGFWPVVPVAAAGLMVQLALTRKRRGTKEDEEE